MTACFVLVLIPLLVFLLSLVFAAVMWSVECEDLHFLGNESIAIPWSSYAYNYGDTRPSTIGPRVIFISGFSTSAATSWAWATR